MEAQVQQPVPPGRLPRSQWPDISNLVTEDDKPLESWYQERQMALLGQTLAAVWKGPGEGRPFLVGTDIGLFDNPHDVAVAPDVMLGIDVEAPDDLWEKHGRSWFVWRYGPPLWAAEIVSNRKGAEEIKLEPYAKVGVLYVVIWDPHRILSKRRLRVYRLDAGAYKLVQKRFFAELGLGLAIWTGRYAGFRSTWLRWCEADGTLLPTHEESSATALEAQQRAGEEQQRAEEARRQAEEAAALTSSAQARAARLAQKLKELGVDPEAI